jgi:hypothetical protein
MNLGGSVRVNPLGLLLLGVVAIFILYYSMSGGGSSDAQKGHGTISIKALLAASIEVSKRGGYEIKRIRDQVGPKTNATVG